MKYYKDYEMVIGLEVHIELKTKTKIFCDCKTDFGSPPNTNCCPTCMGLPGSLPVLNEKVVEYGIKAGLATNCKIARFSKQDRKNYFYPDLPSAYQISQLDLPLCEHGFVEIESENGTKKIGITRIHIEADAGKLVHDQNGTFVDCNRCGMPLIEIVSEPDLRSAEEVDAYLRKLRAIITYTGVSDCKMNEGSMRCDVNLSVRKLGTQPFGVRAEMKNLNSFQFISKAIDYEYKRQVDAIEAGEALVQETRRFDATSGKTYSMRRKENANDYRYFPDPDLPPIVISEQLLDRLKSEIPTLPDERKSLYTAKYGLTAYDSEVITNDILVADYFENTAKFTEFPKLAANILITDIIKYVDTENGEIPIKSENLAKIADMQGSQKINSSTAKRLIKELLERNFDPTAYVAENNLEQINDRELLNSYMNEAVAANPKSIEDYKNGKQSALKAIVGQVMAKTGGKGNPVLINDIMMEIVDKLLNK